MNPRAVFLQEFDIFHYLVIGQRIVEEQLDVCTEFGEICIVERVDFGQDFGEIHRVVDLFVVLGIDSAK